MANPGTLLEKLAAAVGDTITDLRCYDYLLDDVEPPAFMVSMPPGDDLSRYDAILNGVAWWTFQGLIVVGRGSDRAAQLELYDYLASSGARSLKAAIETDPTLAGNAHAVIVDKPSRFGVVTFAGADFWGAELTIRVLA